jgi:hypothetical protein
MGGFGGGEAILRPFLHWQCQLGTVPYFTVITVKYGVIITVVRRNLTSTVRTVQTVIVPYHTTQQAWCVRVCACVCACECVCVRVCCAYMQVYARLPRGWSATWLERNAVMWCH